VTETRRDTDREIVGAVQIKKIEAIPIVPFIIFVPEPPPL
jgi:hypothetical protein